MSERDGVMYQKKPVSNRTRLINIDESKLHSFEEKIFVQKYKEVFQQAENAQTRLVAIIGEIDALTPSKCSNYAERLKELKEEKYRANNALNKYEQLLHNMEVTEMFKLLVDRERNSLQTTIDAEAILAAWKDSDRLKRQQLANSYQQQRNENLQKQAVQNRIHKAQADQVVKGECKEPSQTRLSLKEKLIGIFGGFGIVLFYITRLIIAILPFVMIGGNFFVSLLLISINSFVPLASAVFWIWGLVCAINGIQDIWTILYYVVFAVVWIPFYISTIVSLFKKD